MTDVAGHMITPGAWPSPVGAWPDPPWRMTGRMVTGYFDLPWSVLNEITHPDFLPKDEKSTVPSRVRFYELNSVGHTFREAVIGSPVHYEGIDGESTFVIWTDSEIYQTWGREVFGWPILRGGISFSGALWNPKISTGATGTCQVECRDGEIVLDVDSGLEETSADSEWRLTRSDWLCPRRVVCPGSPGNSAHKVVRITPTVEQPGCSFTTSGHVSFRFTPGHPLARLGEIGVDVEVIDGFEMIVGDHVDLVGTYRGIRPPEEAAG